MKDIQIAPSILSADFGSLASEIREVEEYITYLHIDVMDGHFVPNISIGVPVVKSLRPHFPELVFDVHLMISEPEKYIQPFADAGSDIIVFHCEVTAAPQRVIDQIHAAGKKAGISINPDTDVHSLDAVLPALDLALVMSVFPGFGGQAFIENTLDNVRYLAQRKVEDGFSYLLEIDGGINVQTIPQAARAGAELFVAGNAVFGTSDRVAALREMQAAARETSG